MSWGEGRLRAADRTLALLPDFPLAHWLAATVHVARQVLHEAERALTAALGSPAGQVTGHPRFSPVALHWMVSTPDVALSQGAPSGTAPKTLVVVGAHADDEGSVAPILARYAREGMQVYLIIASDGAAGFGQQGNIPRPDATAQGEELVRQRAEEARCATQTLGIQPPILLGFPDGKLGDYAGDRALIYRVTQRIAEELGRLRPDAVVTWGPDGGTGHPDHRIVSNIVTQLQRAGAPGVPERVFYMNLPLEGMRAMNPQRQEPPLTLPQTRYFTMRVPFAPDDLRVMERSMACHRSQFTAEVVQRVLPAMVRAWDGAIPLIPAFATAPGTDLFQ